LTRALDDLFYTDTIRRRLEEIGLFEVARWFPRQSHETDDDYVGRLYKAISQKFGGYSIFHVSGRFRAAEIASRTEAARMLADEQRYVIDETTAVVRFLIPLQSTRKVDDHLRGAFSFTDSVDATARAADLAEVRDFVFNLFAEAIVRVVQGEDEIWLVEDTGFQRRLYIWEKNQ
jgi:hypothetical protein